MQGAGQATAGGQGREGRPAPVVIACRVRGVAAKLNPIESKQGATKKARNIELWRNGMLRLLCSAQHNCKLRLALLPPVGCSVQARGVQRGKPFGIFNSGFAVSW